MQYAMQVFEDADRDEFRVIDRDGEPWFVLTEVCRKLEIANPRDAASRLDDDEKDAVGIPDAIGRTQRTTIINESGLFSVILTSRKETAKRFKKWVTAEVLPTIRRTGSYHATTRVPAFIRRYNENWDRIDAGCFSVISELATRVWGRLESLGHVMKDRANNGQELRPDVSAGRGFSDWLKKKHPHLANDFSFYKHKTPECEIDARQYPNTVVHLFWEYVDTDWIPNRAEDYFKTRDPAALPYLPRMLPSSNKARFGMTRRVTKAPLRRVS